MRLLLDTHIWIWSLGDRDRLVSTVSRALRKPENELWLSPVSVWEMMILAEKRRVRIDREPEGWIREALKMAPMQEAPVTHEIALQSREVDLAHEDPADRFLVATAGVLDLTLVTADRRLIGTKSCEVLANR